MTTELCRECQREITGDDVLDMERGICWDCQCEAEAQADQDAAEAVERAARRAVQARVDAVAEALADALGVAEDRRERAASGSWYLRHRGRDIRISDHPQPVEGGYHGSIGGRLGPCDIDIVITDPQQSAPSADEIERRIDLIEQAEECEA